MATTKSPKFLRTLISMLHLESSTILSWSPCGTYFQIFDVARLEQDVLPRYFKHSKFASFQRQLNNFGFRKWTKTRANGVCTFSHDTLVRCMPRELPVVTPNSASSTASYKRPRPDAESAVLYAPKKIKHDTIALDDERESTTDVSDVLALDWSILRADMDASGDDLLNDDDYEDDGCVGLPIELFFPDEKSVDVFLFDPLSPDESNLVQANEWQLVAECLA